MLDYRLRDSDYSAMGSIRNLSNQRFGRLTALFAENVRPARWVCVCDCGAVHTTLAASLLGGNTFSCGCLRQETTAKRNTTHGATNSPTHRSWIAMLSRCLNPNRGAWPWYGARGITVDPRWRKFENFLEDMGVRPQGRSLERRDSNLGYSKSNCCWATARKQALSRRNTRWIEYMGERKCLSEWAAELGYCWTSMKYRVTNMPLERALQPKAKS